MVYKRSPLSKRPPVRVGLYITNVGPPFDLFAPVGEPVVDFERGDPLQIGQLLPFKKRKKEKKEINLPIFT